MALIRSFLFTPGSAEQKIFKALRSKADAVIIDLEDAVEVGVKAKARSVVANIIRQRMRDKVFVRINALFTPFALADLREITAAGCAGIMLPKTEDKKDVQIVDWLLGQLEGENNLSLGSLELIPLVESAAGIENSLEIISASNRVRRLAFGALDYTADLGIDYSKSAEAICYARNRMVVASRCAGKEEPVDTVFPDIKDGDGLAKDTESAKRLGFSSKLAIHPGQIEVIHKVFTPSQAEVEKAIRIVTAFRMAQAQGLGVIELDGKMIDAPVLKRSEQILDLVGL